MLHGLCCSITYTTQSAKWLHCSTEPVGSTLVEVLFENLHQVITSCRSVVNAFPLSATAWVGKPVLIDAIISLLLIEACLMGSYFDQVFDKSLQCTFQDLRRYIHIHLCLDGH
ncbi:hypothetical protein CK203_023866 [Vitis vinifera]|uniref:Uncharacterized protein n=1 Tax=Vitis vinifera TaxID=29760 RepID=A0A438JA80_VITVI|nr:hypothetical protein CK203_023866 [Vitis vinifera]